MEKLAIISFYITIFTLSTRTDRPEQIEMPQNRASSGAALFATRPAIFNASIGSKHRTFKFYDR